jgi:DNA-directed RNA polymerase specialized sigma24 family protein
MPRVAKNDPDRPGPEAVPPFWLPDEDGTREIDPRVLAVSKENWTWGFWLITKQLNDGTRTGEIVENVAAEVSNRLRADAEVGRNLNGYFRTALIRTVKTLVARESRIVYEGGVQDLEANHQPSAPDWTKIFEDRMVLATLVPYMTYPVRQIMHYRQLDYSWKYIAKRLSMTEKQAKSRFYYGARQAHEELLAAQAMRTRRENSRNGNEEPR